MDKENCDTASPAFLAPPSASRMTRSASRESMLSNVSVISSYGCEVALQRIQRRQRKDVPPGAFGAPNSSLDKMMKNLKLSNSKISLQSPSAPSVSFFPANEQLRVNKAINRSHANLAPNSRIVRSFSFSNVSSALLYTSPGVNEKADANAESRQGDINFTPDIEICAISNPSLSIGSNFDPNDDEYLEIESSGSSFALLDTLKGGDKPTPQSKSSSTKDKPKLRHRIKRKFLKININDFWKRKRRQSKISVPQASSTGQSLMQALPDPLVKEIERRRKETDKGMSENEIQKEQGKCVSRFERNLLIFDWLSDLEEQWVKANRELIGQSTPGESPK